MVIQTFEELLDQASKLTIDEQLRLLEELAAIVRKQVTAGQPLHSLLELEGLGEEVWKGIDAQRYVDEERDSWNG